MTNRVRLGERERELIGRRAECGVLDQLIAAVHGGQSRALVLHGDPGVGKTALLEYLAGRADSCRVLRATGVQSEMEFPFAALHQLCAPLLDRREGLPGPQCGALQTAFGMKVGPAPDRFLVALAALTLMSESAGERPLLCLVDDHQWLDQASAQVLAFVARRLSAEPVGILFAARSPGGDLTGLHELAIGGLREVDARVLLDSALTGPLDERVRDQIVAETRGNPLALLELPRGLTSAELAGGFGVPGAPTVADSIEDSFQRRVEALPAETRRLLLLAAADPAADPALIWQAAARLGISTQAAGPAAEAGLAEFGVRLRFRHPLVRSVVYRSAPGPDKQRAHAALAALTDSQLDPDRCAWHLAHAAAGPDEEVARELEDSAGRARARGGLAAAAAFLECAAMLTLDSAQRARRALAAAGSKAQAGAFDVAVDLLAMAEAGQLTELQRARADLLRAQLAFLTNRGSDGPPLLLTAARRLEPVDAGLSRAAYLDALSAAMFAGRLAGPGGDTREIARTAAAAPRPLGTPQVRDLLLDGLTAHFTDGYAAGLPGLRRALPAFGHATSADEALRWLWLGCIAALHVWDDEHWETLSVRFVRMARDAGSLSELPLALSTRAHMHLFAGELPAAAALVGEVTAVTEATGSTLTPYGALGLAAFRGSEAGASALIEATTRDATLRGEGIGLSVAEWAGAVLHNGLGRYHDAMATAERAGSHDRNLGATNWAVVELIEAAARTGNAGTAATALGRLAEMTSAAGTEWALGIEARSRALLSAGAAADSLYREAVARLDRTRLRPDLARAHLLFGEWLRRERRRSEARHHLHTALEMLESIGMEAFADRARRELRATGETARRPATAPGDGQLTAHETQIARLARDGMSNPEIGARLFLSPRTVQYHLGNVFTKLGISSRGQLDRVLPEDSAAV
jgi:DNA-binding CsgD family transcriptional regulator